MPQKTSGVCFFLFLEENEDPCRTCYLLCKENSALSLILSVDPATLTATSAMVPFSAYLRRRPVVMVLRMTFFVRELSGYVTYSLAVEMVFTFRGGDVHGYTYDSTIGEFVHTREKMMFPQDIRKKIYSANKGNSQHWDQPIQDAIQLFKTSDKPYTSCFVGSMVANIHCTIQRGYLPVSL
jgi:hypothetical protein